MSDFDKKMRLREKAEEDRYFARRDRDLIRALHEQQSADHMNGSVEEKGKISVGSQDDATVQADTKCDASGTIARYLQKLTAKVLKRRT